jgi:hypothetical protein
MGNRFACCAAVCALVLSIGGCVTLPTSFTTGNVMSVHQGMGSDEILRMFGTPKNVSQAVCGASTGKPWTCTTWSYGEFPYDRANFMFNSDNRSLILNNFDVHRSGGTLPSSFTTENVLKVHQGIGSEEILKLFGTPKNVSQAVCGASTGKPWSCTTWEYGEFPYDRASFTFAADGASLVLNNFDVHRK